MKPTHLSIFEEFLCGTYVPQLLRISLMPEQLRKTLKEEEPT